MSINAQSLVWLAVGLGAVVILWPALKRLLAPAAGRPPQPAPAVYAAAPPEPYLRPGRALINAVEEAGKDKAAEIIEEKLGRAKADELVAGLQKAFAPSVPNAPGA